MRPQTLVVLFLGIIVVAALAVFSLSCNMGGWCPLPSSPTVTPGLPPPARSSSMRGSQPFAPPSSTSIPTPPPTPTPFPGGLPSKFLSDDFLIERTQLVPAEYARAALMGKEVVEGQHNGNAVNSIFLCEGDCPRDTKRIVVYDVAISACDSRGGAVKTFAGKQLCIPQVIVDEGLAP